MERKPHNYTEDEIAFFREAAPTHTCNKLTNLFNEHFGRTKSTDAIYAALRKYEISCIKRKRHNYTDEQLDFLRKHISVCLYETLANMFNEHFGLEISVVNIRSIIHKKLIHHAEGHIPYARFPLGGESAHYRKDLYVKTGTHTWKRKCNLIWEAAHGPIPENHCIVFADGDYRNFEINNLTLVHKREMAIMAKKALFSTDPDLTKTGAIIAKLKLKASDKRRALSS